MRNTITTALLLGSVAPAIAADFQLDYNAHLNMAFGQASTDEAELATHAHDPNDEFTLQGLEFNLSARYGEHLAGFVSYNTFLDERNKWDGEVEEAFLKILEIPGGFEFRGGRLLNRVTSQNTQHLHSWYFADANLITTRFLGDEGLISDSLELSYRLPFEHDSLISVAYGNAVAHGDHGHGHGHGEEEHHDEDEDHHDEDEDHGDEHEEHLEGEDALLQDEIISARLKGIYYHTDFQSLTYGLSYLTGKNGYKKRGHIVGTDLTYQWRENGLESGGKHLRATIEPIYRDFDYVSEDGDINGSANEWGLHTGIGWGFRELWELGLRYDYLQGVGEPIEHLQKRQRGTLALTRQYTVNDLLGGHVRLQYNRDWRDGMGHEDAVWLQLQFDLGTGNEVR
ncbi:hypothetical protein [Rubritalea tangerina]|uniref:Zinc-regulated TonB-dependent outer membrane receptor n=1 Tax=Rubritalea tangerina TaxID=430798 RepID=A0ABW4ZAF4_9BACT